MKEFITTIAIPTRPRRVKWKIASVIALGLIILLGGVSASATDHKTSPDLANFHQNPDGTVDVIIQFSKIPHSHRFQLIVAQGGKVKRPLKLINSGAFRVPVSLLPWLENNPDVAYITPDRGNSPAFDDEIPAVMADVARHQYALDGTGIGVAVIDSGVYSHDDLKTANGSASRIVYSESFVAGDTTVGDSFGHGTHVAGIIGGNGFDSQNGYSQTFTGLAPNVNIVNLRVLDGTGGGSDSQVIAAIGRAIDLKNTYNIRVINLSVGRPIFESYTQDPLCQAVEAAWNAGIVVVVAAGNDGRNNSLGTNGYATIGSPANDPSVITVGATKTNGTPSRLDDLVSSFSSKGPSIVDHVSKPDLVAPGNQIVSLLAPGSNLGVTYPTLNVSSLDGSSTQYLQLSGTSMATPVVAGAAALMIQKDPSLSPDTIKARMMKTAWKGYPATSWWYDPHGIGYMAQYDVFTIGAGYLDVDAALGNNDIANGSAASPTAVFNPITHTARLSNTLNGTSIIWGSSIVWGDSIVWGASAVQDDSIIWGNSIVWGDTAVEANSIIWGDSIVWGDSIIWGDSIVWGDQE
jgi:serine protease AprX